MSAYTRYATITEAIKAWQAGGKRHAIVAGHIVDCYQAANPCAVQREEYAEPKSNGHAAQVDRCPLCGTEVR